MRQHIYIISLLIGWSLMACSTTGTGKKHPVPVVDIDTTARHTYDSIAHAEDSILSHIQDTFIIAMAGDIMMGTTYPEPVLPPDEGRMLFRDVRHILHKADIAVGNLEGTICDSAENKKEESEFNYSFRTPLSFAPRLKEAGFDFLSMANNHAFDFGITGIKSTERALNSIGIKYAGIRGRTHTAIIERNGIRYGLCAFGHNSYTLKHKELWSVKGVLDSLRANADIIIVSFHGGAEGKQYSHLPYGKEEYLKEDRGSLRDFAHFCIDNGADIVYGHGPHVVRCVEVYNGKFIAYSLGNFCTPYGISITGISGYAPVIVAKVNRNGDFQGGKIHSFIQHRGLGPRKDTTNAAAIQIKRLTAADIKDSRITIAPDGSITLNRK